MTCYIEQSVIRRPASMWITAHVQSNDTKYSTGNCPMDQPTKPSVYAMHICCSYCV